MKMFSGVMGLSDGLITNQTQITEDNDGRFTASYFNGLVDLTHIMSKLTGKQLSQMANYRIAHIAIGLRNVDDTLDNDNTIHIGGDIEWFEPQAHTIDMLQNLRKYIRKTGAETSGDAVWEYNDKNYKGLRFGWDSNTFVEGPSTDGDSPAFNGNNLNLLQALQRYATATGATPAGEGYDTTGAGQALWEHRAPQYTSKMPFDCSYANPNAANSELASATPFSWSAMYPAQEITALGGLMAINLKHGNTDAAGIAEDEYELIVSMGITGWSEF
tara:strand:- start:682 stop:1500 length:819 start_codon:yes stop_codon:yes gene_type:complete